VVADVPDDSIPTIVFEFVPPEVTLTTAVRSLEFKGVPDGQSTPVRFTLHNDVSVKVISSTRQFDPIVRRVVLEVVLDCAMVTV
jgi:hypothetical protein